MKAGTAQEIWEAALGELQVQVSKSNYRTWFQQTIGLSYQGNQFVVGVPNAFVAEYLAKNQRSLIEKALIGHTSPAIQIAFQVNGKRHGSPGTYSDGTETSAAVHSYHSRFNAKYTFASFVEGDCNRLARTVAQSVAQNPGLSYNPLFIYGGVGLGKTHLLQAIGHLALANHIQVLCVSGEQFTNEFITALRDRKADEFRSKYRNVGMLLVDDIHFIGGKEQTEESFFHTFNELHNANRQLVITSDRPPNAMSLIEERLRSRFEWGLIVDLQPPDLATRLAILQAKVKLRDINIGLPVLEVIAQQKKSSIRELEGSLNRVVAFANLLGAEPTLESAERALQDIAGTEPAMASITSELIIKAVADCFQLGPTDLKGRRRDKETALARRVAMYLIRQETSCSLAQIGQEMGARDAAAVANACKRITSDIDTSPYLKRKIPDIQHHIYSRLSNRKRQHN